ncbi:PucR-like helix-turn-helix protein [Nocardia tenerifensis]|uniref:PucR-like helix-turn-helix protein n=1 Tax=Nocardia tenerifensis TaxID=228006 RepID=A0A318KDT3_9NOCA|nr:helix-turn-helix domain-containing protein [Nocardia tenerifensis]PXX69240.1 PucR-like helix-turn-helix protein [Nocardia tenerifensis]
MSTSAPGVIQELEIAGIAAVLHLRRYPRLSHRLLDHVTGVADDVAPSPKLPCGVVRREAAEVVAGCLGLVAQALQGRPPGEIPSTLRTKMEDWAAEGVALETVQHATHLGFRFVLDLLSRRATSADSRAMVVASQRLAEVLDRVITTFTRAYLREIRADATQRHAAAEIMAAALIAGSSTAAMARESGFPDATGYLVLALAVPGSPEQPAGPSPDRLEARRRLRRLRTELAIHPDAPLGLLSESGGTVLIPEERLDDSAAVELFECLRSAARAPLLAAMVHSPRHEIPDAAHRAHELLDLVQRLNRPPGLYRFTDLALEYQITRPGPARQRLSALLDPLRSQPELLHTLALYIANNHHRHRTAATLHIHANTLDYRLRRIAKYTGLDPSRSDGLWHLQSALIAHAYETEPATTARCG